MMYHKTFSIILETDNLKTSEILGLTQSIASLNYQIPSPELANEVLLIDSGHTPKPLLAQLQVTYPWLTVKAAPEDTSYYESKMLGAQWATGEIVVYYDSDCLYDRHWLSSLLESFSSPLIQVVGGETTTNGVGIYGTAMALCYIFPQYSNDVTSGNKPLITSPQYFLNNVAFLRSFLLDHPIPTALPLYRGNCVIHAQNLIACGHTIWRQPKARSLHAPPNGFKHFIVRFLLIGHDLYWQKKLLEKRSLTQNKPLAQGSDDPSISNQSKLSIGLDRIVKMINRDWRHAFFLPLCLPIVVVAVLLIVIGYQITLHRPHYLLNRFAP